MMDSKMDVLCIGMALVDSIIKGFNPEPVSASGFTAASGTLNVGGEAVNEAVAAAKLGMRTGILCSLGQDPAGDMIVNDLEKNGVDTSLVIRDPEHPTPVTTMFVNDDGTRKSITNGTHRYNFHPEKYVEEITKARAIILGSLFRAPFDDADIIYNVLINAKNKGILTVADTKLPNFVKLTLDDVKEIELSVNKAIWDNIEVICAFPSEEELEKIDYRSKKELTGDVRIVTIPGYDDCACCAPHVEKTGEIGLLKVISCQNYKGGVRVNILCAAFRHADNFCR